AAGSSWNTAERSRRRIDPQGEPCSPCSCRCARRRNDRSMTNPRSPATRSRWHRRSPHSIRRRCMLKLLVIDDEPNIGFSIEQVFDGEGIRVFSAEDADTGLRVAADESPDVILLDIRLGDRSGLEVFNDLRRIDPRALVVFITGHGTTDTAIEAMKLG